MRDYYASGRRSDMSSTGQGIGYGTVEQKNFDIVHLAATNLIDDAKHAADVEADAATQSAYTTVTEIVILAGIAGLLSIGLLLKVECQIARPLSAITSALLRLASGDRSILVPERHRRDEIGALAQALETFRDNALALAEAQRRAEEMAHLDVLTGLSNRRHFAHRLEHALTQATAGSAFAVMLIDLDRFKPVNDLRGHAVGDLVLCTIASRLQAVVSEDATVARIGGDEFALITTLVFDEKMTLKNALDLGGKIVSEINEPICFDETRITLGASVGIAVCPADGITADDLLRAADLAMYRAKRDGRNMLRVFESSMEAERSPKAVSGGRWR